MKNTSFLKKCYGAALSAALLIPISSTYVQAFGHYTPGALGVNAATLPPPGFHWTAYNIYYSTDTLHDNNGNDIPVDLDLEVFASAHQFTYMTEKKILGADFGFDMIIPLVNVDIEMVGVDESSFGVGDIFIEPFVLGWHTPRWDIALAAGVHTPTGESGDPSSVGKGYYSFMETLGATYYFDESKTWSASVLTRWLQNTEDEDTDITPGAEVVAEYGLAKSFPGQGHIITAGIAGYSYAQLTEDSGTGASDDKYSGHAIGPEIKYMGFKPFPFQIALRYLTEYETENTTEGTNISLQLIGSF
jgi:hypothetical protein